MGQLDNRVAIVTGGARSIGKTFSRALAAEGASVVIFDIADGTETGDQITAEAGVPALAITAIAPAMVGAANSIFLNPAVLQRHSPMGAMTV